jgi:hypothetical protein
MNYSFGKNICAELVNTGGAAGERLITDEFSTDFDEMGIFVLNKDQTFKICSTFLDPTKFSILVQHLFIFHHFYHVRPIYLNSYVCGFFSQKETVIFQIKLCINYFI